ncbi:hypothetical protein NEFER03_1751 [Nematocida sp. LUAm3]|nr:hypothetical protein NEFER03_1751 [Nematocida sp. LUAm3]KAI5173848.1 hypothetical protein NEFER02_0315 [Nematocida sp. LUAm2]KAI5177080.1 hypothetical protein NEFER01_0355 [Nematocida sp. LUAm1]
MLEEKCGMCGEPEKCRTLCMHAFCMECAESWAAQSTLCIICQRETYGLLYVNGKEIE